MLRFRSASLGTLRILYGLIISPLAVLNSSSKKLSFLLSSLWKALAVAAFLFPTWDGLDRERAWGIEDWKAQTWQLASSAANARREIDFISWTTKYGLANRCTISFVSLLREKFSKKWNTKREEGIFAVCCQLQRPLSPKAGVKKGKDWHRDYVFSSNPRDEFYGQAKATQQKIIKLNNISAGQDEDSTSLWTSCRSSVPIGQSGRRSDILHTNLARLNELISPYKPEKSVEPLIATVILKSYKSILPTLLP